MKYEYFIIQRYDALLDFLNKGWEYIGIAHMSGMNWGTVIRREVKS